MNAYTATITRVCAEVATCTVTKRGNKLPVYSTTKGGTDAAQRALAAALLTCSIERAPGHGNGTMPARRRSSGGAYERIELTIAAG